MLLFSCLVVSDSLWPHRLQPPGSSVHRISQVRILQWVVISFSGGSSQPRDRTCLSCIDNGILYHWATWEAPVNNITLKKIHFICVSCQFKKKRKQNQTQRRYLKERGHQRVKSSHSLVPPPLPQSWLTAMTFNFPSANTWDTEEQAALWVSNTKFTIVSVNTNLLLP